MPLFKESDVDSLVFLVVEDYLRLLKKSPVEFQVFQLWYISIYTGKVSDEALYEIQISTESTFPNIDSLPRAGRLAMGRRALTDAMIDKELLNDVRTENTT